MHPDGTILRIEREVMGTERKDSQKVLRDFDQEAQIKGLKVETRRNQLFVLRRLSNFVNKPFKEVTESDIKKFLTEVRTGDGREYSANVQKVFRITLKKFYKWLEGDEDVVPRKVKWLKPGPKNRNGISADLLLTEKDIKEMLEACTSSRDKAIVSTLYESAARASEFLNLKIGDVFPDKYGAKILVQGKTGRRPIRLINSWPYLANWLETHPSKDNPKARLWTAFTNNQFMRGVEGRFKQSALRGLLNRIEEASGIGKHIHPHLFRHSRLTHLAIEGYTEMDLRMYAGWENDSRMPSVYLHLTHKDLDDKILRKAGVMKQERKESELKPKHSPICQRTNEATARFCSRCSAVLDERVAMELKSVMDEEDEILLRVLRRLVAESPEIKRIYAEERGKSTGAPLDFNR